MSDLAKILVEFIGTFVFLSVILKGSGAIPIAVALLAAIYFGGDISGGHFNPAVSVMTYANKTMSLDMMGWYVLAQILGGLMALRFSKFVELTK